MGRLGSGMRVSASFQIIPHPVGRLGLGLGLGTEPYVVGRSVMVGTSSRGGGIRSGGYFRYGCCLRGELSHRIVRHY